MKVRVRHTKLGKVRFVGNLDVTRLWERALRKAALPVAYSTGFSPRPRLSFGLALPMSAGSIAEYLDIEFATDVTLDGLAERLSEAMPVGFDVLTLTEKFPGQVSLQEDVVACDWELELDGIPAQDARDCVDAALAATELPLERERKGETRVDDVRPSIEALAVEETERVVLRARLATVGRGLRPAELISVVFPGRGDHTELVRGVLRTEQWIERDGARRELLPWSGARPVLTELVGA